jgi:hypothetical protein
MTEHTKGPLSIGKLGVIKGGKVHHFTNGSGQSQLFMAMAGFEMRYQERDANAAHLVKCWNLHYDLVAVLRALRQEVMHDCENSDMSREQFEAILNRADAMLEQADAPCS